MSLIKMLFPSGRKFTPASSEVNWQRIETLVHGPGAGSSSSAEDANSAAFACLMTLAFSYPEPPLTVYRKTSSGRADKLPDSPMQALLDSPTPNGELTIDEILFWLAWAKHVDGNAYLLKVRAGDAERGNVVQLWPVSPRLMHPVTEKNRDGSNTDWISYYNYQIGPNKTVPVPVRNVIHFRLGLDGNDMRLGLSPFKALVRQISTDEEADKFVDQLLRNYAVPGLVVIPQQGTTMDEADAARLTEKLRTKFGNDNRGNIAVMSKESKIEQFGFSPRDLDMSILHRIPEERISAVIGVPAIVAGLGAGLDRATYANFREAREMFTEQKLIPQWRVDARKLDTSLKPDFTSEREIYTAFDLSDVRALQEDENEKYTRLHTAVGKPWMTRNEARTDTGQDPVEGWDEEDIAPKPEPVIAAPDAQRDDEAQQDEDEPRKRALATFQAKALKALRAGKSAAVDFKSDAIPPEQLEAITARLAKATTAEAVAAAFGLERADLALELRRAVDLLAKVRDVAA